MKTDPVALVAGLERHSSFSGRLYASDCRNALSLCSIKKLLLFWLKEKLHGLAVILHPKFPDGGLSGGVAIVPTRWVVRGAEHHPPERRTLQSFPASTPELSPWAFEPASSSRHLSFFKYY
jgi:hypothetical protein